MAGNTDMTSKNLYEILGCSPDSPPEKLKQAYHRKILESHPDKNQGAAKSSTIFQEVNSAWKILGDPQLKRDYDSRIRQAELESIGAIVYAKLNPSDLEKAEDDEDYLSYPCRCGNSYLVHKTDLQEKNVVIHVPCQDCTFVIAVET